MTDTFQSLRDTRLPTAMHATGLLGNLVRYDHSEQEAKDLVNAVLDAADEIDAAFAKKWGWADAPAPTPEPAPPRAAIPPGTADGGASFEAEVRWALDAIKRGDTKLAENRLKRILKGETNV